MPQKISILQQRFIIILNYSINTPYSPIRSFSQTVSSEEDNEEWRPSEPKTKTCKADRHPASKKLKAPLKRTTKRTEAEAQASTQPQAPEDPTHLKPAVLCNPVAEKKTKTTRVLANTGKSVLPASKKKQTKEGQKKSIAGGNMKKQRSNSPEEEMANKSGPSNRIKAEVRQL